MKKQWVTVFALVMLLGMATALRALGAPGQQEEPGPSAPAAVETLYTSVTVSPGVSLPDNNPAFTCYNLELALDPAATVVNAQVRVAHTHSFVGDLIYQLHSSAGDHVTMMHRPGRTGSGFGDSSNLSASYPVVFGNAFTDNAETMGNGLESDQVICQDDARCNYYPNPDEDAGSLASFAGLAGSAAAGTWQFCASDNGPGDTGILNYVQLEVSFTIPGAVDQCTIGGWQPTGALHTGRSRTAAAYSEATGNFYVLGGEASASNRDIPVEEYDPSTGTWTEKSLLTEGVSNSGAAAVGAYLYVPGGYDGTTARVEMQRYDPAANEVTLMAPLPAGVYAHAVVAHDDNIHVLGGSDTGVAGNTHYIYDVAGNSWSNGAAVPVAVQYPAAASDGTYIYVLGGNTTNLPAVQRYNPATNSWDTIADMSSGRGGPGVFFDGRNVWVVGGGWSSYLASTEYWDGLQWQPGPFMNTRARTLGAAYGGGIALKAGGWNGTYLATAEVLSLDCAQPDIAVSPSALTESVALGQAATRPLTIANHGGAELNWSTTEAAPLAPLPFAGWWERAIQDAAPAAPGTTLSGIAAGEEAALPEAAEPDGPTGAQTGALPARLDPASAETGGEAADATADTAAPAAPAATAATFYNSRATFDVENPGLPVEDFEAGNVAPGATNPCPAPWDSFTDNACLSAGALLPGFLLADEPGNSLAGLTLIGAGFNGAPSIAAGSNTLSERLHIYFTAPDVTAVGMDVQSHFSASNVDITVFAADGVTVLGGSTVAATPTGVFWGVRSDEPIGRILLQSAIAQAEIVDNLAFGYAGPCATPATLPWASASPANGMTTPGASSELQVTFDTAGLTVGNTYEGTLCINSDDPDEPHVAVPLSLTVDEAEVFLPMLRRQ